MTAKHPTRTKAGRALLSLDVLAPLANALDGARVALWLTFKGVTP